MTNWAVVFTHLLHTKKSTMYFLKLTALNVIKLYLALSEAFCRITRRIKKPTRLKTASVSSDSKRGSSDMLLTKRLLLPATIIHNELNLPRSLVTLQLRRPFFNQMLFKKCCKKLRGRDEVT